MSKSSYKWKPEYPIPPGMVLREHLEARGYSQAEFARRCGRSPKLISEIIAGKAPLEAKTALQFEKVLGLDADIWIGIESQYRLFLVQKAEDEKLIADTKWAKTFPIRELVNRGCFSHPDSDADRVSKLLTFFCVASRDAWETKYSYANIAYRHSPKFTSSEEAIATWLRLGEIEADQQECAPYSKGQFQKAVRRIRGLTHKPLDNALQRTQELCNEAGVVFALIKPLDNMALSGAAWWLSPRKAVVQLTARHKTADHLWFSFFHEVAHILLHSKNAIFVDENNGSDSEQESEANEWASNMLIPDASWKRISEVSPLNARVIEEFAQEQGIAPGIVVGRLQHGGILDWSDLNYLKVYLDWGS